MDLNSENSPKQSKIKSIQFALVVPLFTILVMVLLKFIEVFDHQNFVSFGVIPRSINGLLGILTGPLIHGDWQHLANNAVSLFLFGMALFYFYRRFAIRIWLLVYFLSSTLVWIFARGGVSHIGISGVIYALAFFLFFGGVLRKNRRLAVISLLLTFFYGSMVWGVLPFDPKISWESHLLGALLGLFLAVYYRNSYAGIEHFDQPIVFDGPDLIGDAWKIEEEKTINFDLTHHFDQEGGEKYQGQENSIDLRINYIFKPKEN